MKLSSSLAVLGALVDANGWTQRAAPQRETLQQVSTFGNVGAQSHGNNIVCYYTNWSQYRPGAGKYYPEDIDASLCTHLIFSFAKVVRVGDGWGLGPYEWNDLDESWMEGMYSRFNNLKRSNPGLKTLIAVGGWNHGSTGFTDMVSSDAGINSFVRNSMQYVRENGFDGIDLDWEYPAKCSVNCSPEGDAARFRTLCERFRSEIDAENVNPASKMLVTAAVGIGQDKIHASDEMGHTVPSYDPEHITQYLDLVNLMTYDMHGHWEDVTGHHALAHKLSNDDRLGGTTNLEWILDEWLRLGANPNKLTLGLGAYGRSFALENASNNGYMAPCKSGWTGLYSGSPGTYTREGGYLAYYEICEKLNSGWTEVWIDEGKVPYAHGDGDWVGYDNVESINYKVDMAKSYGLGGIMWWATDIDDFKGEFCGQGKYPLMTAAKNNWHNGYVPPPTTTTTKDPNAPTNEPTTTKQSTQSTQTTRPTTQPPNGSCAEGEFYTDANDCAVYYQCNHGSLIHGQCAGGLAWDPSINACNWESTIDCCDGKRPCH